LGWTALLVIGLLTDNRGVFNLLALPTEPLDSYEKNRLIFQLDVNNHCFFIQDNCKNYAMAWLGLNCVNVNSLQLEKALFST
jgi:hypothetical protein